MRRREFITFIGSATVWPVAVRAQESIRLGFVPPIVRQTPAVVAFFEELSFNGFVEGKNITIVAGSFGLEQDSAAELCVPPRPDRTLPYLRSRSDQRGRTTVSTSAGVPALTRAIARRSAGAMSAGVSIGPSAYQPMLFAIAAKSAFGPAMSCAM